MPTVRLQISPTPAQVRTARLVAAAVARRSGLAGGALDEIRLAVGEACSRAAGLHQEYAPSDLITVLLEDEGEFVVTVRDCAPTGMHTEHIDPLAFLTDVGNAQHPVTGVIPSGFGIAVIDGLVDDLEVVPADSGPGTVVRMSWPLTTGVECGRTRR